MCPVMSNSSVCRDDEGTVSHLSRLGRSPVSSDQALAIATQISASQYVETAAAVSYQETFHLFSMAAMAAIDYRRLHCPAPEPAPSYHVSTGSATSLTRGGISQSVSSQYCGGSHVSVHSGGSGQHGHVQSSVPSSPIRHSDHVQPVHTRSASQPVRSHETSPRSPPLPPRNTDHTDVRRTRTPLTRNSSIRASMPLTMGKPPLPTPPSLPKSPTDLLQLSSRQGVVTNEPGHGTKSRLAQLGVPEGKNYESLKSYSSTASHGSTGSKMSSTSSQMSAQATWSGPRDTSLPDTEDPSVLRNLEFISPKAGVYRPVHSNNARAAAKKDKCSLM